MSAKGKPLIQLYSRVLNAPAPRDFVFPEHSLRVLKGCPICNQQSLGPPRSHFMVSAIQPTLRLRQTLIIPQLEYRHTWRSTRMILPTILEGRHLLSLLRGTIFRPLISPACCLHTRPSSAICSLKPFYTSSPLCSFSISCYWTHSVFRCWSTCRIPFANQVHCGPAFPKAKLPTTAYHVTEVFAESVPLAAFPLCPIDILVYRIKLYLEALLPSSEGLSSPSVLKDFSSSKTGVKASRRISGYTAITSFRTSFGIPLISVAVLASSLLPALFSSSRVKSSLH